MHNLSPVHLFFHSYVLLCMLFSLQSLVDGTRRSFVFSSLDHYNQTQFLRFFYGFPGLLHETLSVPMGN